MNAVLGHVIVAETGEGVAGLVVAAAYALSGTTRDEHAVGRSGRLDSAVTSADGGFGLTYKPPGDARSGWALIVTVSAPDDCGTGSGESMPPLASCERAAPAPRESFRIRIAAEKLAAAGISLQPATRDPRDVIARDRAQREYLATLSAESRDVLAARFTTGKRVQDQTDAHFTRFVKALSEADSDRPGNRYVAPGTSIREAQSSALRDGINGTVNRMGMATLGVFTPEQLESLRDRYGEGLEGVPAQAVEDLLWPGRRSRPSALLGRPLTWWCARQHPINDCVAVLDPDDAGDGEGGPGEPGGPANGGGQDPAAGEETSPGDGTPPGDAPATVPDLIARLTRTMTSPEEKVLFGVRPSIGDIQGNVDGFALRSGPADVPATYDFHRLEIAFESVWQELFDKGALDTGRKLYEKFVELGLDPNEYLLDENEKLTLNLSLVGVDVVSDEPEPKITANFDITQREWKVLDQSHRSLLAKLADGIQAAQDAAVTFEDFLESIKPFIGNVDNLRSAFNDSTEISLRPLKAKGARIVKYAKEKLQAPQDFDQFHELLEQLGNRLKEPYRFNIYAAGPRERSINFGTLFTYRQKWTPVTYQVGELVKTVPLAPKEIRKYTRRMVRKLTRAEKESSSTLQSMRTESSTTVRTEAEIVNKARTKTNYDIEAKAGMNFAVVKIEGETKFSQETEQQSQETKKEFREAVFKAAAEYKTEHKLEVETSDSSEFTDEESGEISNPNDELPVTYLFYELQRRYRIEEKQHKVTPVVLVAQEFSDTIDDDWIVANDWILRQHVLHPSFVPAMDYLSTRIVGDEHALDELYQNLQQQRRILDTLTDEQTILRAQVSSRYQALQQSIANRADAIQADSNEGFLHNSFESLFGGSDLNPEAMKAREEAAQDAYERLAQQDKDLTARLDAETAAVGTAAETYTHQLSEHLNRKTQVSRLKVHIKQNLFHYMQAIYSHEPPDQRYFRLRDVQVPRLTGTKTYSVITDPDAMPQPPAWTKPHILQAHVTINPDNLAYDSLGDIADLDNLLGFKGNYMIFPLHQENALTDFMMTPYYDPFTGLRDPDTLGNWTLHEFAEYVCCLREHTTAEQFSHCLPGLIEAYRRLKESDNDDTELVVPTGSLYIEALPGTRPILEDFKLAHRAIDVKKVQSEVRGAEMENLRMAARLLEGEREDPTIEKKVVIQGATVLGLNTDGE
jgi:hypothetical protein